MKCKLSEKCEFGNLCKYATSHDSVTVLGCSSFKTKEPMTNEQWLHTATTEQLAEWIVRIVDCEFCPVKKPCKKQPCKKQIEKWLKQPHTAK